MVRLTMSAGMPTRKLRFTAPFTSASPASSKITNPKAHRSHAVTPVTQALRSRGVHLGVLGQAQIVIGAEIQYLAAAGQAHMGTLG